MQKEESREGVVHGFLVHAVLVVVLVVVVMMAVAAVMDQDGEGDYKGHDAGWIEYCFSHQC